MTDPARTFSFTSVRKRGREKKEREERGGERGRVCVRDEGGMGWLWLVGSLKVYVSFVEYRLFHRVLLQKRPIISRSLLIVATPYKDQRMSHVMLHMWMNEWVMSCYTCECIMSHMWMRHVTRVNELCQTCEWILSHMWMSPVTPANSSCRTCKGVMPHM